MNRRQQRRERRVKNRENYFHNRRHWCLRGDPLVVMDDPTEEHVKALMMEWLSPRKLFEDVNNELAVQMRSQLDKVFRETIGLSFGEALFPEITAMWNRLPKMVTGAVVEPPKPIVKFTLA